MKQKPVPNHRPDQHVFDLTGRFLFLDGLRALAAVAVMLFHFFNHWVSPIHDQLAGIFPRQAQLFLDHADLGVEVFFVLSGFVIAHSLFDKAITPRFAGSFILRRSWRLDPPYWVVIAASLTLPYLAVPGLSENLFAKFGGAAGVAVNMFYLPDLLWQPRIVGVAWTLCLEVQFYLALLLLLGAACAIRSMLHRRHRWISSVISALLFAGLLGYSLHRWITLGKNDFGGRWFMFFTGVLLYWTLARRINRRLFLGYLLMILALSITFREPRSGAALITVLVIYASALTGGLKTWLGGRAVQYLGRISYSLYLVHMTIGVAVIEMVMRFGHQSNAAALFAFAAAVVASIVAADLLNRCVEVPAMRFGKSFNPTMPRRAAELGRFFAMLAGNAKPLFFLALERSGAEPEDIGNRNNVADDAPAPHAV